MASPAVAAACSVVLGQEAVGAVTRTANSSVADNRSGSVAVTRTVAVPAPAARTVNRLPETDTVATSSSLDAAA